MTRGVILLLLLLFLEVFSEEWSKELKNQIEEAFCDAQCLEEVNSTTCNKLTCNCSVASEENLANFTREPDQQHISQPRLLCKDESNIAIQWEAKLSLIFLVEIKTNTTKWEFIAKTACFRAKIRNLEPDTDYEIRLWGVSKTRSVFGQTNHTIIRTHQRDYQPLPVVSFNISKWSINGNNCTASIEWTPADDYACFYNFVALPTDFDNWDKIISYKVRHIDQLFHIVVNNFMLETGYSLKLLSLTGDLRRESNGTELDVSAPTCLEAYNNDLEKCVPPPVEDIRANGKCYQYNSHNISCDVEIKWTKPLLMPDYYVVQVCEFTFNDSTNIPGTETSVSFYDMPFREGYGIMVEAYSKAGASFPIVDEWRPSVTDFVSSTSSASSIKLIFLVLGSACGILVLAITFYIQYTFKKTKVDNAAVNSKRYDEDVDEKYYTSSLDNSTIQHYIPEIANDEWRLNSEQVVLDELLGEGAFGVVHKGVLKTDDGKQIDIAIKMLKGNPTAEEIRHFNHEIEIMKSVGSHPHLVSLLGSCLKIGYPSCLLVVEYCSKGDLQTYLRTVWEQISGQTSESRYVQSGSLEGDDFKTANNFSNKIYDLCRDMLLESKDLLSFARQIVLGMEYLSSVRVVHRDLAARNVLMCENRTVKIADFGLSRDVYQDSIYTKRSTGKLPVKWLALESLTHQKYTTQSDVWSFGIVLWEIATLGGHPYSTVPTGHLIDLLKGGYRMECPKNCSQVLYEVMQLCWKEVPRERPTFAGLRKILEKLMEDETQYISLDVRI